MNKANSAIYKIINFPLTKIILGLIACIVTAGIVQFGFVSLFNNTTINKDVKNFIGGAIAAISVAFVYMLVYSQIEKRKISELSVNNLSKNIFTGIVLGVVLQSLTIFVIYLDKGFSIISVNSFTYLLPSLTMGFTAAILEEILFRGIIFRITEEKLGSYLSLLISALLFGAIHLMNPNSSLIAAFGLAIQAGFLLGAAYIYSRNLWFPIAIHFAWNFTQSGIFGAATSGNNVGKSLITSKIEGNEWITGGKFGPEGSVQATLFCLMAAIILLALSKKQNKIINPYWKK